MYSYNAGASSFTSPYRFNGKEKDPETGYGYYGARYYQSKFSVWMSVDPLAHETLEPYLFTGNNPIMLVDPTGMNSEEPGEDKGWFGNLLCKVADWFNPREPAQFKEEPEEKPANVSDAGFPEMLQQVDIVEDAIEPSSDQAITTIPIEPPGIPLPLFTAPSGATAAKALRWLGWISIILTIPGDKRAEDQDLYYPPPKSLPGFPGAERVPNKGRARWKTPEREILEWDYQHGEVEVYDKKGKHKGSKKPDGTGGKPAVPGRKTRN